MEASRRSRESAWEKLQEIHWAIKDVIGTYLPPAKGMIIDLEGRVVKDGMSQVLRDRRIAVVDLVRAIEGVRKHVEKLLTALSGDYAQADQGD